MKKSQRSVLLVIIVIMALAVGLALLLEKRLHHPQIDSGRETFSPQTEFQCSLIKGCLFDLGITRENTHIEKNTISVYAPKKVTGTEISRAFAPLKTHARVDVRSDKRIRVIFDDLPRWH